MRKLVRVEEPFFLSNKWEQWGLDWEQRRATDGAGANFHWHQVDNGPVNHKLLPYLKEQTQEHCSFCDGFPVNSVSVETIEHFRPKIAFPRLAYNWENLFYCCSHCQMKGGTFDDKLLKPDSNDFTFDKYFRWDFTTGKIEINESASEADKNRARVTIEVYRLNEFHPSWRRREMRKRTQGKEDPLDDFAYRDFIENPS